MRAPDRKPACFAATLALVSASVPAIAADEATTDEQESPSYEAVVTTTRVDDGLDSQRRLDRESHGFATAIEIDPKAAGEPADALPDVVTRVAGATVRSIGGLGQFSAVSLRGSSGQQVAVFLDGVPLGNSLGGLVSLSDVPLDALHAVEIYRGFVPVTFGGATIGGAVNLVGRVYRGPARVWLRTGVGSFGAREAQLTATTPVGAHDSVVGRVGYASADGDFPYYDIGNTPLVSNDDATAYRENNGYRRLFGQLRVDGRRGATRYGVQQLALSKEQGVAGSAGAPARRARLESLDLRNVASARRSSALIAGDRLSLLASLGYQRRIFRDPDNEVGLAQNDQRTGTADIYLSPRLRVPLWRNGFATLVADGRYEWVDVDNRLPTDPTGRNPTGDANRQRGSWGAGLQLEQYLWQERLIVAPIVRFDLLDSRFAVSDGNGEQDDSGRNERLLGLSPRLGARLRALDWLELRSSVGRYFRAPTLMELFGDQGFVVGNEGLLPERGTAVDAGVVLDTGSSGRFGAYAQAAGFVTWSEDLIQWAQAGPVTRPMNVDGARVAGFELGTALHAWARRLTVHGSYTFVDSVNRSSEAEQRGKALPGRPRHSVYARAATAGTTRIGSHSYRGELFYTLDHIAGTFLDPSGRLEVPARTLHGVGVDLSVDERIRFGLTVRNLFDRRTGTWTPPIRGTPSMPVPISDFIGHPLPGRSLWLGVSVGLDPTPSGSHRVGDHDA